MLGKLGSTCKKKVKLSPYFRPFPKVNLKLIEILYIKLEFIKYIEKNIDKILQNMNFNASLMLRLHCKDKK